MAAGDPPTGPSIDNSYLYRMQQAQGQGGNGAICGMLRDVQFTCFKLPAGIVSAEKMVNMVPQAQPGLFEKWKQATGLKLSQIFDAISKMNKENMPQPMPFQQASQADVFGQGGPSGGYAANIGPRGDSDFQMT